MTPPLENNFRKGTIALSRSLVAIRKRNERCRNDSHGSLEEWLLSLRWPPATHNRHSNPWVPCAPFRHNEITNETDETNASKERDDYWRGTL